MASCQAVSGRIKVRGDPQPVTDGFLGGRDKKGKTIEGLQCQTFATSDAAFAVLRGQEMALESHMVEVMCNFCCVVRLKMNLSVTLRLRFVECYRHSFYLRAGVDLTFDR